MMKIFETKEIIIPNSRFSKKNSYPLGFEFLLSFGSLSLLILYIKWNLYVIKLVAQDIIEHDRKRKC